LLKPGARIRSKVCTTEVIVVRPPVGEIDLRCGGAPMAAIDDGAPDGMTPAVGFDTGTQVGKRYTTDDSDGEVELLVVKQGQGTLSVGDVPMVMKEAKALPSSD
jgi:hypothetical protein